MNTRLFKIIWLPIMAIWVLLWVIYLETYKNTSGLVGIPLIPVTYFFASGYLAYKLKSDLEVGTTGADPVITVAQGYAAINCLIAATLFSVLGILLSQPANLWFCMAIIACPIILTIIEGLSQYSEDQLTDGFKLRSQPRAQSQDTRQVIKGYLSNRLSSRSDEVSVALELQRISKIVDYSSYFRHYSSESIIQSLDGCNSSEELVAFLRGIQ